MPMSIITTASEVTVAIDQCFALFDCADDFFSNELDVLVFHSQVNPTVGQAQFVAGNISHMRIVFTVVVRGANFNFSISWFGVESDATNIGFVIVVVA